MPTLTHLPSHVVRGELASAGRRPGADSGDPQVASLALTAGTGPQIGVWQCEPGGWPVVDRPDTETCYIVSGRATITDDETGTAVEISAGDVLVLPVGWTGRWDVTETLRKVYVVC